MSGSTGKSASQFEYPWNISDLKSLKRSVFDERAAALIGRISKLARGFIQTREEQQSGQNAHEDIRGEILRRNPALKIVQADDTLVRLRARFPFPLPRLPGDYLFKGGAARMALRVALCMESAPSEPRDLDIVRLGAKPRELDKVIARRYMPDDFRFGHGVELCGSIDAYMDSRDITVNEVLLLADEIICSQRALNDTLRGILRPVPKREVATITVVKLIRLYAEAVARGEHSKILDIPQGIVVPRNQYDLHRKRARKAGESVEREFIAECKRRGIEITG